MADTTGGTEFQRMGLTPVINAGGTNTKHSGSRMRPEVIEAIQESSEVFLNIDELLVRAGEMIAEAIGVEAALVTSGAAGGLVLQAAAVMTGTDMARIQSLPITDWFPNELIIQRQHRFHYDHAYLMPGAKFVEVGKGRHCYPEEVEAAITPNTAAMNSNGTSWWNRSELELTKMRLPFFLRSGQARFWGAGSTTPVQSVMLPTRCVLPLRGSLITGLGLPAIR